MRRKRAAGNLLLFWRVIPVLLLATTLMSASAQAGILQSLLKTTGLDVLLGQLSHTTGIQLEAQVMAVDDLLGGASGGLNDSVLPLNLNAEQQRSLAAMDLPEAAFSSLAASAESAVALTAVARAGNDQPALTALSPLDVTFTGARVQTRGPACGDGDGDGVCDQQDQCLKTPAGRPVMGNGCHLEGPVVLRLEGVIFLPGSTELSPAAAFTLQQAARLIQSASVQRIEVAGHSDAQGPAADNLRLSRQRAQVVAGYLQRQGVDGERLLLRGYGDALPIASNDTEVGRARNRRVELRVLPGSSAN